MRGVREKLPEDCDRHTVALSPGQLRIPLELFRTYMMYMVVL